MAEAANADYPFEPWYYITGQPDEVAQAELLVRQWQQADADRRPLRARIRMLSARIRKAEALMARPAGELRPAERELLKQLAAMKAELPHVERKYAEAAKFATPLPDVQLAIGAREAEKPANAPILLRGEWDQKDEVVPRGFLSCVTGLEEQKISIQESGRLQLARWVTDSNNPLTARVAVNRIWHHLMGRGIVHSLDNFGSTGSQPTHPELLDWLAHRFVHQHRWSVKRAVREIVLSRTYQLAATHSKDAFHKDPSVELFWRARPRRLETEAVRDALLAISGNLQRGRPRHNPLQQTPYTNNTSGDKEAALAEQGDFRSIYVPIVRGRLTEFQTLFDQPVPDEVNSARNTSTLASQALYLMNGQRSQATAAAVVERLFKDEELRSDDAKLERLYLTVLARPPTSEELQRDKQFLAKLARENDSEREMQRAWNGLCLSLLMSADFLYRF